MPEALLSRKESFTEGTCPMLLSQYKGQESQTGLRPRPGLFPRVTALPRAAPASWPGPVGLSVPLQFEDAALDHFPGIHELNIITNFKLASRR